MITDHLASRRRVRPSASLVISIAALVLAATGGGYAAGSHFSGASILKGTITKAKLSKPLRNEIDHIAHVAFLGAKQGPAGPSGPAGPQGAQGPPGAGARFASGVPASAIIPSGGQATATSFCPSAGQTAVSGTFSLGPFSQVVESWPLGNGTGWTVTASAGTTGGSVTVSAVCVGA